MEEEIVLLTNLIQNSTLMSLMRVRPEMLEDNTNKKILRICIDLYNNKKDINFLSIMSEAKKDKEIKEVLERITLEEIYIETSSEKMFKTAEEKIVEKYKRRAVSKLTEQLQREEINQEEFYSKIKVIENFKVGNKATYLTEEEIENNIYIKNKGINLKKFPQLSRQLNLFENDFLIIGATTGIGKSSFLLNLMNAFKDDYQCMYFNLEMSKMAIYRRLIAINGNVPIDSIDSPSEYQSELIKKSKKDLISKRLVIESSSMSIDDIKSVLISEKDYSKHTIIFLDHIGLIKAKGKDLYEKTTEIAKELRKICLNYNATVIGASQLNRSSYNSDEITLNMLKDSGELENSARKVILISRETEDKTSLEPVMNIEIAKNDSGMTGIVRMKYYKIKQTFEEISEWKK